MPNIITLNLSNTPYGSEVELSWEFSETVENGWKLLIFKRAGAEPTNEEVNKYIDKPERENVPKGLFVFLELNHEMRGFKDVVVEAKKEYFYKAVLVKYPRPESTNQSILKSDFATKSITVTEFAGKSSVVDTKKISADSIKKITEAIYEISKAKIDVYNEFPIVDPPSAFIVVTRATTDDAIKFWNNIDVSYGDSLRLGDIESDVIAVTWETAMNPKLRDDLTDIFRAAKFRILNYLKNATKGVIDVKIKMEPDGQDLRIEGHPLIYGQMLIHFLVQNTTILPGNELGKSIEFHLKTSSD